MRKTKFRKTPASSIDLYLASGLERKMQAVQRASKSNKYLWGKIVESLSKDGMNIRGNEDG